MRSIYIVDKDKVRFPLLKKKERENTFSISERSIDNCNLHKSEVITLLPIWLGRHGLNCF